VTDCCVLLWLAWNWRVHLEDEYSAMEDRDKLKR